MKGEGIWLVVAMLLIMALACPLALGAEVRRVTLANQAKIAQANAQVEALRERQKAYEVAIAQAQVEALRAEGEKAVLESAANAVYGNTEIVARLADDYFPEPEPQFSPVVIAFMAGTGGAVLGIVLSNLDVAAWLRRKRREKDLEQLLTEKDTIKTDRLPASRVEEPNFEA